MNYVLHIGLHRQPGTELRLVGEFQRGLAGRGISSCRLGLFEVRSVPRCGEREPQRVLGAIGKGAGEGEPRAQVSSGLVDASIA